MGRPPNPELREKILDAAGQIIEGCGPDCVTMREVAEKVGYSPTTLYSYFKDKNAILKEEVLRGFDGIADASNAAMVGPGWLDKLRQRCRGYVVWGLLHPGHYRLMFEGEWDFSLDAEEGARSARGLLDGAEVMRSAIEAGELPPIEELATVGSSIWAALHGVTSLAISRRLVPGTPAPSAAEIAEAANRTADTLLDALLASLERDAKV